MPRSSKNPIQKLFERNESKAGPRRKRRRIQRRLARVTISANIAITTIPGSLYATLLKVLASAGRLHQHDFYFAQFMRQPTLAAARQLFQKIAVLRRELEKRVRADPEFKEHCRKRTAQYKNRAAAGDKRYQRILRDPKICDANGRWKGDIDEGISILSGGRDEKQVKKGKNLQILNRAGLMFDAMTVGSEQICVLFRQKHRHAFAKAMKFICPPPTRSISQNG